MWIYSKEFLVLNIGLKLRIRFCTANSLDIKLKKCISESFNKKISLQLFDQVHNTFVNSQHQNFSSQLSHHNFCNQPFFALYFSAWEISRRFSTRAYTQYGSALCLSLSLSLYISLTSLYISLSPYPLHLSLSLSHSLLSLPPLLYLSIYLSLSPSTFLSSSLSLLSIILFGVSNGRFRPCLLMKALFGSVNKTYIGIESKNLSFYLEF